MNWNRNTKEQIQYASACMMLLAGVVMGFIALAMNDWHLIPDSVLWFVAQCFVYAGSIFGVAMVINYKFGQLVGDLNKQERAQTPREDGSGKKEKAEWVKAGKTFYSGEDNLAGQEKDTREGKPLGDGRQGPKLCGALTSLILAIVVVSSCGTHRPMEREALPQRVAHDTVYLNRRQYDSVFVVKDCLVDRSRDTVYFRNTSVEYRFKLLHDTAYVSRVDSIPVVREVTVTKREKYIPWPVKALSAVGCLVLAAALLYVVSTLLKIKK